MERKNFTDILIATFFCRSDFAGTSGGVRLGGKGRRPFGHGFENGRNSHKTFVADAWTVFWGEANGEGAIKRTFDGDTLFCGLLSHFLFRKRKKFFGRNRV